MIGYIISFILLAIGILFDNKIAIFFLSHQIPALTNLLSVISDLGTAVSVALIIIFIIVILKDKKKLNKELIFFLVSFGSSLLVTYLLKISILRERPLAVFSESTGPYNEFHSFPSGHSTGVFSALVFMQKFKIVGVAWLIFSLLVAFSRIYLGFHYLSDVVAGGLIGYTISWLIVSNSQYILKIIKIK